MALLYDVEGASPGFREFLKEYSDASRHTRATWPSRLDLPYGQGAAERLDLFLPKQGALEGAALDVSRARSLAPVIIFVHGGGWRASSKEDRAFPAEVFCTAGAVWISLEYPLAPAASLDEMVTSVRRGIAWVHANAMAFGGDPGDIHLCGNSAGGHLVAMAVGTDWVRGYQLPADLIKSVTTLSGVFQMLPLVDCSANDWLKMGIQDAVRNSPAFNLPAQGCPLLCAVGADEPPEFIWQSETFAEIWANAGHPARFLRMEGRHHFSIIGELGNATSPLVAAMLAQMGLPGVA